MLLSFLSVLRKGRNLKRHELLTSSERCFVLSRSLFKPVKFKPFRSSHYPEKKRISSASSAEPCSASKVLQRKPCDLPATHVNASSSRHCPQSAIGEHESYTNPMHFSPSQFLLEPTMNSSLPKSKTFYEAWNILFDSRVDALSRSSSAGSSVSSASSLSSAFAVEDLKSLAKATQNAEILALFSLLPKGIWNDVSKLISVDSASSALPGSLQNIVELYIHVGQKPRLFFSTGDSRDLPNHTESFEIETFVKNLRGASFPKKASEDALWGQDHRAGVPGTLHRVGFYLDKTQNRVLGCTIRFGRYIPFAATLVAELLGYGSVIIISAPCQGKTTILRDCIARLCNSKLSPPKVVVVDTSNEIVGDADEPAPYFGTVRRLQVPSRDSQSEYLVQAIQNHSPDIVVVDEVGNTEECEGICSIIHRGTRVLCSVHGSSLAGVVRNLKLNVLFGGSQPLLLSYDEKRAKQKLRKTALERMNPIGFHFAIQLKRGEYGKALLYVNLDKTVDRIYDTEDWTNGGADMAYEVDLGKPLSEQSNSAQILKVISK